MCVCRGAQRAQGRASPGLKGSSSSGAQGRVSSRAQGEAQKNLGLLQGPKEWPKEGATSAQSEPSSSSRAQGVHTRAQGRPQQGLGSFQGPRESPPGPRGNPEQNNPQFGTQLGGCLVMVQQLLQANTVRFWYCTNIAAAMYCLLYMMKILQSDMYFSVSLLWVVPQVKIFVEQCVEDPPSFSQPAS